MIGRVATRVGNESRTASHGPTEGVLLESDIPLHKLGHAWAGLERPCPRCGTRFVSKFDRGQCPTCGHMFLATEEVGIPEGTDVELLARQYDEEQEEGRRRRAFVSPEQSARLLEILTEPAGVEELDWPHPPRPSGRENPFREEWEEDARHLRAAISDGGVLWHWSETVRYPEARAGSAGLAVVKDGRVTARMMTMRWG